MDLFKKNQGIYKENKVIDLGKYSRNPKSKIFQKINIRRYIEEQQNQSFFSSFFARLIKVDKLYPAEEMKKLSEECQGQIVEAENDPEKQFYIGTYLIEGKEGFPLNIDLGIKYLERSISYNNIESTYYLGEMLFKGKIVEQDLQKAKKYLLKQLNANDSRIDILYSKICMKEKNYKEAIKYFEKQAKMNDFYAMYKYGKMMFLGLGCEKNIDYGLLYINLSINSGFQRNRCFYLSSKK